ncbi:MAG: DUF4968 domain-containing protein [Clostridiales bacterium]|nr:DUF4968 domain-containing protein [Candidatus Blautia equi]
MSSERVKGKAAASGVSGTDRVSEEKYLRETIKLAQKNLEDANESVKKLSEDLEDLREAYEADDKEGRVLWNNAKAQYKHVISSLARYEKARKKPYFGRIDFRDANGKQEESYYIGRVGIARTATEPAVIDWRTPVASVYYENAMGKGTYEVSSEGTFEIDLKRKRSYEIENDKLKDFYDLDVVANDELLTKYLSKNKTEVLGEIIATIQKEQNRIIRRSPRSNMIVQGVAGSGKTTVAMHRISYILYNYEDEFRPDDFCIIGSNKILLNYITSVLPELDVYGVRQMTMEQLFIRLLYEDWDERKYTVHSLDKKDVKNSVKGSRRWFQDLEKFCRRYEMQDIPQDPVYLEKTGELLLDTDRILSYIKDNPTVSLQSKRLMLNEILFSKYENIILSKHISFTQEEKKRLERKYKTYYGRDAWKGSIYEIYQSFLTRQRSRGDKVDIPNTSFDVYDLAALAYIYKRIKEIDPIREATHVVIDEAQDFGMMAYCSLHYCINGCTYTIMGDTSQNIHYDYGLNDWDELKKLVLTGLHDKFSLLRKSYRNTVEISEYATEILRHGDFSIYPVEPIIRHGNPVRIAELSDDKELLKESVKTIKDWQKQGYETIAVVCRDEEEAALVSSELKKYIEVKDVDLENPVFGNGVMVLPVAYTKGLEFDTVLVYDPTTEKYPVDNGHVKMLYVTATRALHELTVLHKGDITPLLGEKAPAGKHLEEFETEEGQEDEEIRATYSKKEIVEMDKDTSRREMALRNYIGPERVLPSAEQVVKKNNPFSAANMAEFERTGGKSALAPTGSGSVPAGSTGVSTTAGVRSDGETGASIGTGISTPIPAHLQGTQPKRAIKRMGLASRTTEDGRPVNISRYAYGESPDNRALAVNGHSRPNTAVRWVKKNKTGVEVTSSYGVITFTPINDECIRVTFVKGQLNKPKENYWKAAPEAGLKWTAKESPSVVEIATKKIIIHIDKKDGAIQFLSADRKMLLRERANDPRLVDGLENWSFFDLDKKEQMKSRGILGTDINEVSMKAKYISFGAKQLRMPLLLSSKGYAIAVASEKTVMYCGIPMYGQYIYTEGAEQIDYFFLYNGTILGNAGLCDRLFKK